MPRFTSKWPQEIKDAIADAQARNGIKTEEIYTRIRSGTLQGLSRPYPDYPRRTFFQHLSDVRTEQRRAKQGGGESLLDKLRRLDAEEAAQADAPDVSEPDEQAALEAHRERIERRLRERRESLPPPTEGTLSP